METLEVAGEVCFAVADAIRLAESQAQALEGAELCIQERDLPDEYATLLRQMAEQAIGSTFAEPDTAPAGA